MADTNLLKYTSRDYNSIKSDLLNAINAVTSNWTSREESDPGIILLNLMSYLGDNLSFNLDMQALEMYLPTVTQRKNIKKILSLMGYNVHWYRSAIVDVTIFNNTSNTISINTNLIADSSNNRLNTISGTSIYTILPINPGDTELSNPTNSNIIKLEGYDTYTVTAVQGDLQHSDIGYSDINDDKFYIPNTNIDEAHLYLYDVKQDETEESATFNYWELVKDISFEITNNSKKCFEFDTDEYDRPFIKLPRYWKDTVTEDGTVAFRLYYLLSNGSDGNVASNAFYSISETPQFEDTTIDTIPDITLTNYSNWEAIAGNNTPGFNPQTTDEARSDAKNYINTFDTLITISDFEKFIKQQIDFNASLAIDVQRAYDLNMTIFNNLPISTETSVDKHRNSERLKKYVCGYGQLPSMPSQDPAYITETDVPEYTYSKITDETLTYYVDEQDIITAGILNEDSVDKYELNIYCIYRNYDRNYIGLDNISEWDNPTNPNNTNLPPTAGIVYPYRRYKISSDVTDGLDGNSGINAKLREAKIMNVKVNFATCRVFDWRVTGTLFLRKPVTEDEANLIIDNVINSLANKFTPDYVGFGQKISYMDVIETIQNSDSRIRYVDAGRNNRKLVDWSSCFDVEGYFNPISIMRFNQYSVKTSITSSITDDNLPKYNKDEEGNLLLVIDDSCIIH